MICDLTIYKGWRIYTHVGKVPHNEIPDLKRKIKGWFDQGEWVYEDNYKTLIYKTVNLPVQVIFEDELTEQEKSMGLNKYGIVFKSDFFDWKNDYPHQQLCYEVLRKITWGKRAYLLKDNELIPVAKRRILRMKK